MEEYSSFDLLRCSAGARLHPSGPFPAASALVPCLRNASLYQAKKSLVLACVCESSRIVGIERQMRRLFGPMGGSGHQDVLSVGGGEEATKCSSEGGDFEVRAAYRTAKRKLKNERKGPVKGKHSAAAKGDKVRLNGTNPRTRWPSRRDFCDSAYHLLPRCPHQARRSAGTTPSLPPASVASRRPYSSVSVQVPAVFPWDSYAQRYGDEAPCEGSYSIPAESCLGAPPTRRTVLWSWMRERRRKTV